MEGIKRCFLLTSNIYKLILSSQWAHTMSNSFRMSGDITDSFNAPDVR